MKNNDDIDFKYLIFRTFSKEERPNVSERSVFFAWSIDKNVVKAFLSQRDKKKYKVMKIKNEVIRKEFSEDLIFKETELDFIKLRSVKSGEEITFFTTGDELRETEIKIQRKFHNASSLENLKGNYNYLEMIMHLDKFYFDALDFLGYRPPELDSLYPSADERDNFSNLYDIEESIEMAYGEYYSHRSEFYEYHLLPLGTNVVDDVASKIIYSLESFIMILKNDL